MYVFFQNPKKHDFLRFFELLHTFSRTVAVADMVCGRYRRFPNTSRVSIRVAKNFGQETDEVDAVKLLLTCSLSCKIHGCCLSCLVTVGDRSFASAGPSSGTVSLMTLHIGLIAVSIQKETENTLILAIISGRTFLVCYGFLSPSWSLKLIVT